MALQSAFLGRDVAWSMGGTTIAYFDELTMTINNERVDISAADSDGWAAALAEAGQKSVSISGSGVTRNMSLAKSGLAAGSQVYANTFTFPDGGSIVAGDFFLDSVEIAMPEKDKATFSASLSSSNVVTFTDPA
jgi:TP901-1 family phage major tail protein